jgi:uncharacterized membrane protein (UPF0127 family)
MKSFYKLVPALSVCVFLVISIVACDSPPIEEQTPKSEQKRQLGPQFINEGTLHLISAAGDTIRTLDIEIADTENDRTIGLMHRRSMPDTQGMLFIFDEEEPRSFWMRNTLIGLDIIYIRANGEIESIAKYTVPLNEQSIPSKGPATYVLEVIEGFCDRYNVKEGDKIAFSRNEAI